MSKQPEATLKQQREDTEARVALLEYQFGQFSKALERIEGKQDAAIRQIDTLKYVSQHEFDEFKKDVSNTYATITAQGSQSRLLYWILGLIGSIFLLAIAAFIGLVVKP